MTARIKDSDIEHLSWIYDRLANVHLENTNFDYMHKLNAIIANLKLDYAYYGDLVLHREEVRPVGELIETQEEKEALDEKTYRYEKVELSPKEVFMAMLNGDEFYVLGDLINFDGEQFWRHTSEGKSRITYINHNHEIHRRIEVTERELFIDAYASTFNTHMLLVEDVAGMLYDSGKFKLVNGKG